MSETMNQRSPPGAVHGPQEPTPQTVEGYLGHEGFPSVFKEPLSGGFLDIPDIANMPMLLRTVTVDSSMVAGTNVLSLPAMGSSGAAMSNHWRNMVMLTGDYISYNRKLRFWIVGSPRLVGKLYVQYVPNISYYNMGIDKEKLRMPMVEWDLAKTDYCEIDCPMFSLNKFWDNKMFKGAMASTMANSRPRMDIILGTINLQVGTPLRVGSVLPDTYTIFVYDYLPDLTLYGPTDCNWARHNVFLPRYYKSANE